MNFKISKQFVPSTTFFVAMFCLSGVAWAEVPTVSYIFPAGGQRGSQVNVRIGGHYLYEKTNFEIGGPGVVGPKEISRVETLWFEGPIIRQPASQRSEDYPKDFGAMIEIAADAPLGSRGWRVWNSQGITPVRKFVVGELPEVVEDEIDGEPLPVAVSMPLTINGRIYPREDIDIWTFDATAGKPVCCSVAALSIGSPLDARLELRNSRGETIAEALSSGKNDPVLLFSPPETGRYELRIHDIKNDGHQHFVYRLTISHNPWLDSVYPQGGQRGTEVAFEVVPRLPQNVVAEKLPAAIRLSKPMSIPKNNATLIEQRFELNGLTANPLAIAADDFSEVLEQEPNDQDDPNQVATFPAYWNGRIDRSGDKDVWCVEAKKGQLVTVESHAVRLGSTVQLALAARNSEGKELVKSDALNFVSGDPRLNLNPPADGKYFVEVRDLFPSRGGPALAYRLKVTVQQPTVRLEVPTEIVAVDRGKSQKVSITVTREGGFNLPVTVSVEGLPDDIKAEPVVFAANKPKADMIFQADEKAKVSRHRVRIVGKYEMNGESQQVIATPINFSGEEPTGELDLAVTMPTPFKFVGEYAVSFAPCGHVMRKTYRLERGGYEGPLDVQLADRQGRHLQGVTGSKITVPAGADEFTYHVQLASWMELGRTVRVIPMLVGEITDEQGVKHKVSYTNNEQNSQLVSIASPSPLRLVLDRPSVVAKANSEALVNVQIRRDKSVTAPVRIELVLPKHIRDVRAEPVVVPSGATEIPFVIKFGQAPGPLNMPLVLRAISEKDGDPLISEILLDGVVAD